MNKYNKGLIPLIAIIIIVAVVIIGGGVAYYYTKKPRSVVQLQQTQNQQQNQTKNNQTTEGVYNNYGFYFKYPKELGYVTTESINANGEKGVRIDLGANNKDPFVLYFIKETEYSESLKRNLTFKEIVDAFTGAENVYNVEKKNITIDGKSGVWIDFKDRTLEPLVTVYIPLDEKGNIFIAGTSQNNYDAGNSLNQILSTLKFTK